ncbi:PREDICTED: uncharacterized protein LOC108372628 [Rhagoletis zephyria]|uniref:uncharacterized protein LOC108372628 n=1 Tax=Rhagoletis zephyria TaxID=28612 RepID=UPI0008117918|nr:PREDICTED: uncharacterized protein LOC108372628 [Rhagoletis zephyria]
MNYTSTFVLLLICLSFLFIIAPRQIDAEPRVGSGILSTIRSAQGIPPESLVPRRRVKRIKRNGFDLAPDHGDEFINPTQRTKERFPVWDDANGEPPLN